jgi:hypothetical protein
MPYWESGFLSFFTSVENMKDYQDIRLHVIIPVHGKSRALAETLHRLENLSDLRGLKAQIIISNSGESINGWVKTAYPLCTVLQVPSTYFWTKAVENLYKYCHDHGATHVLLLNHDCYPVEGCISRLFETVLTEEKAVCHATLVYRDEPEKVWWAGTRIVPGKRLACEFQGDGVGQLPRRIISTSSTMGQCLLMPIAVAKAEYLHSRWLPHYFSDSVQTTCMRRGGYNIFVRTDAIAYSDQSDHTTKMDRIRCDSVAGILRGWFMPYSSRNLVATAYSAYIHQDKWYFGLLSAAFLTLGKIGKSLHEWLQNCVKQ